MMYGGPAPDLLGTVTSQLQGWNVQRDKRGAVDGQNSSMTIDLPNTTRARMRCATDQEQKTRSNIA